MNTELFLDLHDLLVERYGLEPSLHMSTHEMLAMFLYTCGGNESNRRVQNRFKHSGETISRKFDEVLNSLMVMAKDYIRPKDPNFRAGHKRIRDDKRASPISKIVLVLLMELISECHHHLMSKLDTLEKLEFLLKMF
jgi:hypothetical protein